MGGVSNVMANLITNLSPLATVNMSICGHNNYYLANRGIFSFEKAEENKRFLFGDKYEINWAVVNKQFTINKLKSLDFDVFHPTHYDTYFLDALEERKKPFVFTMHDLISAKLLDYVPKDIKHLYLADIERQKLLSQKAAAIIAISEHTKQDMIDLYGINEDKIKVVHNGYEEIPQGTQYKKLFDFPYILYVGTRCGYNMLNYKGFDYFFNQIAPFLREHPDFRLVCVGKDFSVQEKYMFHLYGLEDRVIADRLSDEDLNNAYHYAFCFVFPSMDEGFGLPILEAYKNDCIALLNKTEIFTEIAGDSGQYFSLPDGHSLEAKLNELYALTDEEKQEIIAKQRECLKNYSWKKTAQEYLKVYESVC